MKLKLLIHEATLASIKANYGNLTKVAADLGIGKATLARRVAADPDLRAVVDQARQSSGKVEQDANGFVVKDGRLVEAVTVRCHARQKHAGAQGVTEDLTYGPGALVADIESEARETVDELIASECEGGWWVVDPDEDGDGEA